MEVILRHCKWIKEADEVNSVKTKQTNTETTHLITEDNIILLPTEENQIESHKDHSQVCTQGMQVAKHTGGQPVTHTHLLHGNNAIFILCTLTK